MRTEHCSIICLHSIIAQSDISVEKKFVTLLISNCIILMTTVVLVTEIFYLHTMAEIIAEVTKVI